MKKSIKDFDITNKKVIIRVDYNVPIKNNQITDDTRIRESLKTIQYAIDNSAKIILLSHLGRVKTKNDKDKSLKIVADRLQEIVNTRVIFINETRGQKLEETINKMQNGEIVLMENTRFEDIDGNKESSNDLELGKYWASLGDIFINDAFATSHRKHASNVGIASNLSSGIGFLIEKEIKNLSLLLNEPLKPYTIILGGSKVSDKIGIINSLTKKCDYILIGGAMAYTFLYSKGYNVGKSLVEYEYIDYCKELLYNYPNKIILPSDSIVSKELNGAAINKSILNFNNDDIAYDIGEQSIVDFKKIIDKSNTIFWNGPLGMFEYFKYSKSTKEILSYLDNTSKTIIIGGGDTASAAINFGYKDSFTHISTGGGASLELLEGKELPGIEIIEEKI